MIENVDTNYPQSEWRLLITPPNPGALNMAIDEAILETVGRGDVPTTLRLYAWDPPCLSLGYAQPLANVDLYQLTKYGWDIVRRPTGGRAILHANELTYSVIAPHTEIRMAGSVLESYYRLSQALLRALNLLKIPAKTLKKAESTGSNQQNSRIHNENSPSVPVCFEVPSTYEITVLDKKLIGSAQARRKEGILQHGSLPLYGDIARIIQVLKFSDEEMRASAVIRLINRATTIESILGARIEWETAAQAFSIAFQQVLNLIFQAAPLTSTEESRANELVQNKYTHPSWTERI
jgi:lipoyl(octanoyl) transferase